MVDQGRLARIRAADNRHTQWLCRVIERCLGLVILDVHINQRAIIFGKKSVRVFLDATRCSQLFFFIFQKRFIEVGDTNPVLC